MWTKKKSVQAPNTYLNCLINPSFQGVNRLFVWSFENTSIQQINFTGNLNRKRNVDDNKKCFSLSKK